MLWRVLAWICAVMPVAFGNPVITEFMADNETTISDEDGDFSDWIEIHNPGSVALPLADWCLTDKADSPAQWRFPAVTLEPGGFLVVWASGKNRRLAGAPLHTNFSLSKNGEFLALVRPDGSTIEQSFAPAFPAQDPDVSFGLRFQSTTLIGEGATGHYRPPTGPTTPGPTWNDPSYVDSFWPLGASGYGFGITVPGITIHQVFRNGSIGGLDDALSVLALPEGDPGILFAATAIADSVNLLGDGSDGHYGFNSLPPGGEGDHYAIAATGYVTIPAAGVYTFGINSDDGGRILIDGSEISRDDSFHGPQDQFGSIYLSAGTHSFEAVMFQGVGGDCMEFFAAPGSHGGFDAGVFRLVGDVANGGLAVTTTPAGAGGVIATNLSGPMSGRAGALVRMPFDYSAAGGFSAMSLVMRYNDGFAAWINGVPMASANAPAVLEWDSTATASRSNEESLRRQGFNVTSGLASMTAVSNVLAIHGLRTSTADESFLLAPELVVGALDSGATPAFYGNGLATPGWINGLPSSLGEVADTQFSVKRGIYTSPLNVAITSATPGAVIRYTTDGSTPDETHGTVYTTPVTISSTTVLRAVATLDGWESTDVDTQTYLFPDDVVTQSANGAAPSWWPSSSGTGQVLDFGMDPEVVNHSNPEVGGVETVKSALLALPSVSITTDLSNLFDADGSQGIYSHPSGRGLAWERPASLEWINPPDGTHPNGTGEFQIDAGIRIRGGFSRSEDNPKHAFRFYFREEYGSTKLRYPLFGRDAAQDYDQIDLRTAQNYSWSFGGDDRNTFLREESARMAQLEMGHPGSHVRYVHLYLNGQYWGLYNLDERTEASFSESYLGGDKADYDVVKSQGESGFTVGATDGNLTAWQDLWNLGKTHRASPTNANYFRMMGLAADGSTPTADPVLLDPDNLIDYLLLTMWSGNLDGCVSAFLGNVRANNWFASRRRENNPRQGFRFFVHDFEHTLLDVNEDRTGPFSTSDEADFNFSNPMFLHQDLIGNAEYRMRWADRIQRHMFNGGALTPEAWQSRINQLAAVVDVPIIAESARWGDAKVATPRTRLDWINARDWLQSYFGPRNQVVLNQLRADNLYPNLDAPVLSPFGGYQPDGVEISVQGPAGATLYYMADGSDPRAVGGAVRPGALTYSSSTTSEPLIPWSAGGWKYLGTGVNAGTTWRYPGYDDSTWPAGSAELGYGDGDEATVVPVVDVDPGTSGTQKAATCYFRRAFDLSDIAGIAALSLSVEYDDAYAVYLNGTRVAGNLPADPAFDYYSGGAIEDTTETTAIPPSLLQTGSNLIAVEIHQANNSSSDISMNLSLTATRSTTATPLFLAGPGERTLRFRALSGGTWSAMTEAVYQVGTVPPTPGNPVVSEICYFPPDPHGDAEFVELLNAGTGALDLAGARFTTGIDFEFPAGSTLAPGGRVLVVRDLAAFEALYGTGKPVAGEFANGTALSNAGERLVLEAADGAILLDFTYGTNFPWPDSAKGLGRSLVLTDPAAPSDPLSWRPSAGVNGNPGSSDSVARLPGQDLVDYALGSPAVRYDSATGQFVVNRRLGADGAKLQPEWSTDLSVWSSDFLTLISETPDSGGNSSLRWQLDPLPSGRVFLRVRVTDAP